MIKEKHLLKVFSLVITICLFSTFLLGGAVFASELVTFTDKDSGTDPYWPYFDLGTFPDLGYHFSAKTSFDGGELYLYVGGDTTLTATLYRWNMDYATSIKGTALAKTTFTANRSEKEEGMYAFSFSKTQAAGEYILLIHADKYTEYFIPGKNRTSTVLVENYVDGEPVDDTWYGGINFTNSGSGFNSIRFETVPFFDTTAGDVAIPVTDKYAIQFAAAAKFDYVKINCPSWSNSIGSLSWTLYEWKGSYYASIESAAIAAEDFIDYADSTPLCLSFDELPAGEYILLIENISEDVEEQVGVWGVSAESAYTHQYVNGDVDDSVSVTLFVNYRDSVDNKYGALSKANVGTPSQDPSKPTAKPTSKPGNSVTGDMNFTGIVMALAVAGILLTTIVKRRATHA